MFDRGRPIALEPQSVGQVVMRGGQAGMEPDRCAKMSDRLVHGPEVDQCGDEIAVSCRVVGLEFQGRPIGGGGLVELSSAKAPRPVWCGKPPCQDKPRSLGSPARPPARHGRAGA